MSEQNAPAPASITLAELFASAGLEVRASFGSNKQGVSVFVRDVYNALNNGSDTVVVLAYEVGDDIAQDATENAPDDTLVIRNMDTFVKGKRKGSYYDAKTLMDRIDAKNAASHSDPTDDTLGKVKFSSPLYVGDDMLGFVVTRTA